MGEFSFVQFSSAFIILFAIIDITGSIPIILSLKSKGIDINPVKTSSVALGILLSIRIMCCVVLFRGLRITTFRG